MGVESVSHYLGNDSSDVILATLPRSFDAGFSQLTTAFHVGAHDAARRAPRRPRHACLRAPRSHRADVRPTPVDPDRRSEVADRGCSRRSLLRQHRRKNAEGDFYRLRAIFPKVSPFLMYGLTESFRSRTPTPPRSTGDRNPSAMRFPTPRSSSSARTARSVTPARRASCRPWRGRARLLE